MKRIAFLTIALALVMAVVAVHPAQAHGGGKVTLEQVRDATEAYHKVSAAKPPDTIWFPDWIIVSINRVWVGWDITISTGCSIILSTR